MDRLLGYRKLADVFRLPEDPRTPIFKYMDFAKYVAMLRNQAITLSRVDLLDDPLEGRVSRKVRSDNNADKFSSMGVMIGESIRSGSRAGRPASAAETVAQQQYADAKERQGLIDEMEGRRSLLYVSCWHAPKPEGQTSSESMAMWRLYGSPGLTLAVESTVESLQHFFEHDAETGVGLVSYRDYDTDDTLSESALQIAMQKQRAYRFEDELRVLKVHNEISPNHLSIDDLSRRLQPRSISQTGDLGRLISRVIVSPEASAWFTDTVAGITRDLRFESWSVRKSKILET